MQNLIDRINSTSITSIGYYFKYESYLDLFLNYFRHYKRVSSSDEIQDNKRIILDFNPKQFDKNREFAKNLPRDRNIIALTPVISNIGRSNFVIDVDLGLHSDLVLIFGDRIKNAKDRYENLRKEYQYSEIKSIVRNDKIDYLLKNY